MTVTSRRVARARVRQFAAGLALAMAMGTDAATPKFYPDDPDFENRGLAGRLRGEGA